uniref:Pseudouridine synthase I TruA alpha/beta domain-containing protein n=1 Tax=Chrysotila carterae TaxID=13221 RepID=A0A7S4F3J5_CHRCT
MSTSGHSRAALEKLSKDDLVDLLLKQGYRSLGKQGVETDQQPRGESSLLSSDCAQNGSSTAGADDGSKDSHAKKKQKKREPRPFDMSNYGQRHIALRLAYDGGQYCGMACQQATSNTIEGRLFEALLKTRLIVDPDKCSFSRGGRTDKGVSALGQVVGLRVRSRLSQAVIDAFSASTFPKSESRSPARSDSGGPDRDEPAQGGGYLSHEQRRQAVSLPGLAASMAAREGEFDYVRMLNASLPAEIRVLSWSPVPETFSARFGATHRTYKYFFLRNRLDVSRMRRACELLIGWHDFRNFCKIDPEVKSFTRRLYSFSVEPVPAFCAEPDSPTALWHFTVRGSAFLYNQVRCMVAVLFLIGEGKESPEVISDLLDIERTPARPIYDIAPGEPLVLFDIGYNDGEWVYDHNLLAATAKLWTPVAESYMLHCGRTHTMLDSLTALPVAVVGDKEGCRATATASATATATATTAATAATAAATAADAAVSTAATSGDTSTALRFVPWSDLLQRTGQSILTSSPKRSERYVPLMERQATISVDQKKENYLLRLKRKQMASE